MTPAACLPDTPDQSIDWLAQVIASPKAASLGSIPLQGERGLDLDTHASPLPRRKEVFTVSLSLPGNAL